MDPCVWLLVSLLKEKGILNEAEYSWLRAAYNLDMEEIAAWSPESRSEFIRNVVTAIPFPEYQKMLQLKNANEPSGS